MKAAVRRKYGPFTNVRVEDIERPSPKPDEVLVRVHATTVNRTDCGVTSGKPWIIRLFIGLNKPKRPIIGTDFAGVIEAVGSDVTNFEVGDRVCGFRDEGMSSQAEYLVCRSNGEIMRIPSKLDFHQAAASLEAAHYAYNFLDAVSPKPGDNILINGGTGAIGSALIQFAKAKGMRVTAVCATPDIERVRQLGADVVLDYSASDFTKDPSLAGTFDHVLDAVGKRTFGECKRLLKPRGTYSSSEFGPKIQNPFLAIVTARSKQRVLFPLPRNIKRSMSFVSEMIEQGKFMPLIDRTYSLNKITDAYTYVASGQKIGNVILDIAS